MHRQMYVMAMICSQVLAAGAAGAGTVTINPGATPGSIIVQANDATLNEIMTSLSVRFKFKIESSAADGGLVRTGQWVGTVDAVITRLLRNQNHLIVRSADASSISRIVLDGKPSPVTLDAVNSVTPPAPATVQDETANRSSSEPPNSAKSPAFASLFGQPIAQPADTAITQNDVTPGAPTAIIPPAVEFDPYRNPGAVTALTATITASVKSLAEGLQDLCRGGTCGGSVKR